VGIEERGRSSGRDGAVVREAKKHEVSATEARGYLGSHGCLGWQALHDADRPGIIKTQAENPKSGDPTATLVLGLLEMKGEGFFRRARDKIQIA